ncbi:MAG: hypothetical protein WHV28_00860 [Bacteroidota bacterium]
MILSLLIYFNPLLADNNYSIEELLKIYINSNDTVKSLNYLSVSYGISNLLFGNRFKDDFSNNYVSKIEYGFYRDRFFDEFNILSFSSGFVYLENISSHFKPQKIEKVEKGELTVDGWNFGFGLNNGYGYNISNSYNLLLEHISAINWNRIDFEVLSRDTNLLYLQKKYDEKYKFGYLYSAGISFQANNKIIIGTKYSQNIIFNDVNTKDFLKMLLFDNLFQFWIELFDPVLRDKFKEYYPLLKFLYKNSISITFSNLRKTKESFPFGDHNIPLNINNATIHISYIFE